ncbi:glycosyltransferase [Pseudothermotoga elfii]
MKIFIVGYEHPCGDKRTLKSALNLSKLGKVYYQYYGSCDMKKLNDTDIELIEFEKLPPSRNILKWFKKWKNFDERLFNRILEVNPDVVYFHYLPFTGSGMIKRLKQLGKKIFFEIHEIIPEQFMGKYAIFSPVKSLIWKEFSTSIRLSDGVICISEDIAMYVFDRCGIQKEFFILPNMALMEIESNAKSKEIVLVGKDSRELFYEKEILRKLIDSGFRFKVIGLKSDLFKDIPYEYVPFLPYDEMMEQLSRASFSLISYGNEKSRDYKNYEFSMPNKLFDSIAAGTPVIVRRSFVSMVKIVERFGVGVVIEPRDVESSVEKILKAYDDYDRILSNLRVCKKNFVWSEEKDRQYLEYVSKIMGG